MTSRRRFLGQVSACMLTFGSMGRGSAARAWQGVVKGEVRDNLRRYPLPATDGVMVDPDAQLLLARSQGEVVALSLACPHEHAAVRWVPEAGRFQCSKHDSRYTVDGRYLSGRSTRSLDRFPIRREDSSVLVDVTRVWRVDTNPAEWMGASVAAG